MQEYKNSRLLGNVCTIEDGFAPVMDLFCTLLDTYNLKVFVISSFRMNTTDMHGAIVTPAKMSNHLIGHGIDVNFLDKNNKLWNSHLLIDPKDDVLNFITDIKTHGIRWGGDFTTRDPIHFDDGLNLKNPELWHELYDAIHSPQPNV